MVDAGEASGTLEIVLLRLAEFSESQVKLKNRIKAHFPRRFITRQNFPNDEKSISETIMEFVHV